jgi:predicted RNA methylase
VRIESLPYTNAQTQGPARRAWLRIHAPEHLEQCEALMLEALQRRRPATSPGIVVLGAGACTEVPLAALARAADEVVLVDIDLAALQWARQELPTALRRRVQLLGCDLSGGVSERLDRLLRRLPWEQAAAWEGERLFTTLADLLEACPVPDPPAIESLPAGAFGLAISSLLLSQLYSYPLLDVLDYVRQRAPQALGLQESHRRYQEAAQRFRLRIIQAHLHLLRSLVEAGGLVVVLTDLRGFLFNDLAALHKEGGRQVLPLVPYAFFRLLRQSFRLLEERRWLWLSDLPAEGRPGRAYEVAGYLAERE